MFHVPELSRIRTGPLGSDASAGNSGAFEVSGPIGRRLLIIADDGQTDVAEGWEHVSVRAVSFDGHDYTPMWGEMVYVKDLFWDAEDCVIQYHPPMSKYVNNHSNVLHLWRPTKRDIPLPPQVLV